MEKPETTVVIRLGRVLYYACYEAAALWMIGTIVVQGMNTGWWGPEDRGLRGWWQTGVWIWPDMTYFIIGAIVAIPLWLFGRACLYVLAGE